MPAPMAPRMRHQLLSKLVQSQAILSPSRIAHLARLPTPSRQCASRTLTTSSPPRQDPSAHPPPPTGASPTFTASLRPDSKPSKPRRGRRLLFAATFLLLGTIAGSSLRLIISPPDPPAPGTEEDGYTISVLQTQASHLPIVKQLEADPAWESWEAYNTLSPEHRAQHITAGALRGSRGVGGYQRIFYNALMGEFISVIYFGAATTGWPGVVHGGALATVLDESCGRAAFKQWGGLSGMTAYLKLEYKKPSLANRFYVLRVKPRAEKDLPEEERGKRHYKAFVDALVEDALTGRVTVTAEALFVGGQGNGKKKGKKEEGGIRNKLVGTGKEENQQF